MSQFPVLSGKEACKVFRKPGYVLDRQTGSHLILRKPDPPHRRLTIPNHKEIAKGTMGGNRSPSGIDLDRGSKSFCSFSSPESDGV